MSVLQLARPSSCSGYPVNVCDDINMEWYRVFIMILVVIIGSMTFVLVTICLRSLFLAFYENFIMDWHSCPAADFSTSSDIKSESAASRDSLLSPSPQSWDRFVHIKSLSVKHIKQPTKSFMTKIK